MTSSELPKATITEKRFESVLYFVLILRGILTPYKIPIWGPHCPPFHGTFIVLKLRKMPVKNLC